MQSHRTKDSGRGTVQKSHGIFPVTSELPGSQSPQTPYSPEKTKDAHPGLSVVSGIQLNYPPHPTTKPPPAVSFSNG